MMSLQRSPFLATLLIVCSTPNESYGFVSIRKHVVRPVPKRIVDAKMDAIPFSFRAESPATRLAMWSSDEDIEGSDRFKACVPYLLPLLDGEIFGKYIYERVPPLGFLDSLFIGPLYETFSQVPLLGLIVFVALTIGTRGNTDMSRGVRFSAQQAALIDVALVFPELIGSAFEGEDMPRYLVEPCMNFVWYVYMSMVLYSIYKNLRGKKPDQIPWVSGYAEMMVGPF